MHDLWGFTTSLPHLRKQHPTHPLRGWKTKPDSFYPHPHPRVETSAQQASGPSSSFPDLTPLYSPAQPLVQPPSLFTHPHGRRLWGIPRPSPSHSLIFFFFFFCTIIIL